MSKAPIEGTADGAPAQERTGKVAAPKKAAAAKAPPKAKATPQPQARPAPVAEEDPVLAVHNRVTRAAMARSQSMRPPAGGRAGETRGRLWIDPATIPPGMEAQWIRETVHGERDDGNIEVALADRGFRPATREDFPGLQNAELPDRRSNSNLIRRGGQILMLRPKQEAAYERETRKASDAATLRAVNKELAAGVDGKAVQALPDAAVQVSLDRSNIAGERTVSVDRFSDA